jgi:transposase
MSNIIVGLDIAKTSFQVHCFNSVTGEVKKKTLTRNKVLDYFSNHEKALIGIESCGGSNFLTSVDTVNVNP